MPELYYDGWGSFIYKISLNHEVPDYPLITNVVMYADTKPSPVVTYYGESYTLEGKFLNTIAESNEDLKGLDIWG